MADTERRRLCEQASADLGILPGSVEKDHWICWALRELFSLPELDDTLTFKGGTSLAKGWKLIARFSEDVDVVISRVRLGFDSVRGPDAARISGKEVERRLAELSRRCREFIGAELHPALARRLRTRLGASQAWSLALDPQDREGQTLLFEYPTVFAQHGYVRPVVRIELGARSDVDPVEHPSIRSFLVDRFPDALPDGGFSVPTVAPVRTFWEKAMLLHEERHRTASAGPKPRLSRHYYDLWCLIEKGVAGRAAHETRLFGDIARHRAVFFRKSQQARDSLKPGSLQLLPREEHRAAWEQDFASMRESMFIEDPPSFGQILDVVRAFEEEFNAGRRGS